MVVEEEEVVLVIVIFPSGSVAFKLLLSSLWEVFVFVSLTLYGHIIPQKVSNTFPTPKSFFFFFKKFFATW